MAISFQSQSYRAAASDLTIAISPLGLVELADEEFEVHGPRLNRYSNNWAFYLGHHWAQRRPIGEPQLTFNWCRAFSDFMTNFTMTNSVSFQSPHATEAIIPELLRTVWEEHQPMGKDAVLWEALQQGSVSGDCFLKIAFEEPYVDPAGNPQPPRIRILPLNAAFCFPEYHPHDLTRLLRMKMKYRFWACVDPETEGLTRRGWKRHDEITTDDEILTLNPWTDAIEWQPVQKINVYSYQGEMHRWAGKVDALTTPNHRWLAEVPHGRAHTRRYEREIVFSGLRPNAARLITGGGTPMAFSDQPKWSDEVVETVGWYLTEGVDHYNQNRFHTIRISQHKDSRFIGRLRRLAQWWRDQGMACNEWKPTRLGVVDFYFGKHSNRVLEEVAPGKQLTPEFLCSLTFSQAKLLYETLLDGDGHRSHGQEKWTQIDLGRVAGFQMLSAMLGLRGRYAHQKVTNYATRYTTVGNIPEEIVEYDGLVWCPTVENSIWLARRNGTTYWTGNTALEGTRQVLTYCVDDATEALTRQGWKSRAELTTDDDVLAIDPATDEICWEPVLAVNEFGWDGPLVRWQNRGIDALTTPNHRWLVQDWRARDTRYAHSSYGHVFKETHELIPGQGRQAIIAGGGTPMAFSDVEKWDSDFVELAAWIVTEGHYRTHPTKNLSTIQISQSESANPDYVGRLRRLQKVFNRQGIRFYERSRGRDDNLRDWFISGDFAREIRSVLPDRQLTPEFLCSLTYPQARLLYETLIDGDGHRKVASGGRGRPTEIWAQKDQYRLDGFQMLCAMLGRRTNSRLSEYTDCSYVTVFHSRNLRVETIRSSEEHYTGKVWCPSVRTKTWLARRNGVTYFTGNTELWTEDAMQSFINDELIDSQENPLGAIPFVHISNTRVPSSPWGLSDIYDITDLNRQFNETATLINDIIDYYASPTTILTGAKATNLERGPQKVWAIPNDKAKIQNLELGNEGVQGPIAYLDYLKQKMHELVGIPQHALGEEEAISNTSGVALQLQFLPLMQKWRQKIIQYKGGLEQLNRLIIKTAALYMPEMLQVNPERDPPLEDGQFTSLNPRDPLTYENTVEFHSPLPLDKLVALNEIQMRMALGIESKTGALRTLGEAYPAEKLQELIEELHQDALEQGALDLLKAEIAAYIQLRTGLNPTTGESAESPGPATQEQGGSGQQNVVSAGGPGVNSPSGVQGPMAQFINDPAVQSDFDQITQLAAGTKLPQVRNPAKRSGD